jgi:hypothetical protein
MERDLTVAFPFTDDHYLKVAEPLIQSAEQFNYGIEPYKVDANSYTECITRRSQHWRRLIEKYGKVLIVDADAIICKPIESIGKPMERNSKSIFAEFPSQLNFKRQVIFKNNSNKVVSYTEYRFNACFKIFTEEFIPYIDDVIHYANLFGRDEISINFLYDHSDMKTVVDTIPFVKFDNPEMPTSFRGDPQLISTNCVTKGRVSEKSIVHHDELHLWDQKFIIRSEDHRKHLLNNRVAFVPPQWGRNHQENAHQYLFLNHYMNNVTAENVNTVQDAVAELKDAMLYGRTPTIADENWEIDIKNKRVRPKGKEAWLLLL